jgi:signal transduction histidine kinase
MKKVILRYGGYSALAELVSFILVWLLLTLVQIDIKVQGTIGWVVIVCPLVFVYFGIRYFRDHVNNGSISFLKALQIGLVMILIPAVAYAIIETVYVEYLDPKFYERISQFEIAEYQKTLSPAALAAKLQEIKQELALNANPLYNFSVMVAVIYALGTIITVLSSLLLMKQRKESEV